MEKYQLHLVDSMKKATDTAITRTDYRSKIDRAKIDNDTLELIKEKWKLRRQYANQLMPSTKTSIP